MKGFDLAVKVQTHLKSAFPGLELTIGDKYWDNAMWHARVTGCIAEAGVKNGFKIELGRRFMHRKTSKEIDYFDFLKRYCALYDKYVGRWTRFGEGSSTEVDVVFLDPRENLTIVLCEYENKRTEVKDNVVKFRSLHSFDPERFRPEFCLIGFWGGSRKHVETVLNEASKLIADMARSEEASYRGEKVYQFRPLQCCWLLFGLFKNARAFMVKCMSTILEPKENKVEEQEFDIGSTFRTFLNLPFQELSPSFLFPTMYIFGS